MIWKTKYNVGEKVIYDGEEVEIESVNPYSTEGNVQYLVNKPNEETCFPVREDELSKPNGSCWAFNMNQSVRVRLTDLGYELLAKEHNRYLGVIPAWEKRSSEDYKKKADKEGYTSFQLWDFMETFGAVTGMCKPQYYDNRIVFDAADFEKCSS